jgi:hypothetical protein
MNHVRKAVILLAPLIVLLLGACSGIQEESTPAITATTTPSFAITPTIVPSSTATPEPSTTPTQTAIPTPIGAGLVEPEFEFVLDTPLEEIPPGEYIILWDIDASDREGTDIYRYISWDGSRYGPFFHLVPLQSEKMPYVISIMDGRIWYKQWSADDLFIVDIPSLKVHQFSFGSNCEEVFYPFNIGPSNFAFACLMDGRERRDLFIISLQDWNVVASKRLSNNQYFKGWIGPDRAEIISLLYLNSSIYKYCILESPEWDMRCHRINFDIETTSPDGKWVWTHRAKSIVPKNCILEDKDNCSAIPIDLPPEWKDKASSINTPATWSLDSQKLIVVYMDCTWHGTGTWVWYYDLQSQQSVKLTHLNDCFDFSHSIAGAPAIWSDEGDRFILETGGGVQPVVVMLDGRTYRLPTTDLVVGSITLP